MSEYKTGDSAPKDGKYTWVGFEKDGDFELPENMKELDLEEGNPFPPIRGQDIKGIWKD